MGRRAPKKMAEMRFRLKIFYSLDTYKHIGFRFHPKAQQKKSKPGDSPEHMIRLVILSGKYITLCGHKKHTTNTTGQILGGVAEHIRVTVGW